MDHNDSDYEGQNLHLTGEESSKVSVLRPFALPKFDFDDSLHGHLRFDSLVENEAFLGIPSQEDNHWIEDFSRGGSGIEFSSRAAESCALPRHINVWSEATSTESVEMLLKAVGQEEMVPGGNIVEQSDPGDQLGSTAGQMANSLNEDFKVDDAGNLSASPVEVGRNLSRLNQSAGEDVRFEDTLQAQETSTSSSGTDVIKKDGSITMTMENSNVSMEGANNFQLETSGSVDESVSNQMQESLPVLGEEIEISESASQNIDVSVMEPIYQAKISGISLVSSSCKDNGISDPDDQEERCNENDSKLIGIASETDNIEKDCADEFPSGLHSPKDHVLETSIKISGDASSIDEVEKSISAEAGRNKIACVLEPADCIQHGTVSGTKNKQLSESSSILHEKPLQGEGEIERIDGVPSPLYDDNAAKQVGVILSPDERKSGVGIDDTSPNNNSSLEAPCPTSESSLLPEVLHNPSEKVGDYNTNRAEDVPGISSEVSGECCGVKSLTEDMKDASYTTAIPKENRVDEDHFTPPLVAGGMNLCTEYVVPMQVDAPKCNQDVFSHGREGEELPHDSQKMELVDTEKEVSSICPAAGDTVEKTSGLQSNISTMNYPVLNTDVEDTELAASCVEGDGLVDSHEHNPPPCDLGNGDQSKENEVEASKQPSLSVPKESCESIVLAPAIITEKGTVHDPAAGEMNTSHQSVSFLETSSVTMPEESSKELSKNIVNSGNVSIVQEAGVESEPTKEPVEAETDRNTGTNSSALSVSSCAVEIGKFDKQPIPDASCTQSQANKQAPLKSNNGENIGEILTTSENSGVNNDPSKEEGTFTFDIRHLGSQPAEDSGKDMQSFPRLQACKQSSTGKSVPSVSSNSKMEQMVVKETSHVSSSTPGVCPPSGSLQSPIERKLRRGGGSKSGKGSLKKGNLLREIFPLKQSEKGDKSPLLLSSSVAGQLVAFESGMKPRGAVSIPTSSLPDLNTSAPSSVFFQQPFTDLQQVQLRAQIFVYGSLIQGTAPDEACMVSAFDGGRSVWERSWRACVDKLHGQKSQGNNTGTPVSSRSGAKAPEQINKQGFPQNEVVSSSAGRASNKAIQSPVPLVPLSSPLWSISTPAGETLPPSSMARGAGTDYQAVSPLNPYQTPPLRNSVAHTTWLSQAQASPTPFPVPWLSSSSFEISSCFPTYPNTELVKKNAVKESSLPIASGAKHATPILGTHTESSTMLPVASPLDSKKGKLSTGLTADTKTRKRKKSSGAEDVGQISVTNSLSETVSAHAVTNNLSNKSPAVENPSQISLIAQSQMGSLSSPVVGSHLSTSVAFPIPSCHLSKGNTNQTSSVVLPSFSSGDLYKGDLITDKRALKFEGFSEVEEAKLQAQEAAAHAATAVSKCEDVWSHLYQQKSSGLTLDNESKLASAAVAVAAAASVAKAAAAAAKIASNAAVQAKQMADEAMTIPGTLSNTVYDSNLVYSSRNLVNVSPGSILKGGDRNNASSLAISSAREAARKRIEAASAATRHAENLDAIVKAAELAAEAVSHAGKVVAMGDPFSLGALAEAGPDNYWKVLQVSSLPGSTSAEMNKNKSVSNNAEEVPNVYNQHEGPDKDMRVTSHAVPIETELSRNVGDPVTLEENLITSAKQGDDSSKPCNDIDLSDSAKTAVVSDTETESRSLFFTTSIKEGSHVEVLKDHDDLKKAWFSASVLTLKDGRALVCYNGLQSGEGSEQLKEWVSLEAKDGNIPKIRIPHPMTTMLLEGTRKRRRSAVKDYNWSVGDRVDAWVRDCWCEGIVTEKNKKDATALSIHFPAHDETLNVKIWHLRPSLVWSDGEWIEWSKPRQEGDSQGDTPVEKRPKLASTNTEVKGKAQMAKNINFVEVERNEEPKLPLAANEKVFNIGSTREENKPSMVRTIPPGLEKERPRVIFGVPKPGKKRKFMEVSKHYVSDRTAKTNVPSDSVKLAKLLTPQGSGSRGFRNSSNLDFKEKQVADSKPRTLKSGKPPSIPSRTLSRKDNSTSSRPSARDAAVFEHSAKGSISNDENESSEQNLTDTGEASVGTMVFSSQVLPRKKASRNTRSERLNQGKLAPARGKSVKDEVAEKIISDVAEPRRSNRRIQPTSRLLEGLQSSLIISKIPSSSSSSQDKSHRNFNKSSVRGNSSRG